MPSRSDAKGAATPADRTPGAHDRLVCAALAHIDRTGESADRVAKRTLQRHPELDSAGRARVARGIHGVRCFEARIAHLLTQVGLPHLPSMRWAVYRVDLLDEAVDGVAEGFEGPMPGLRRIAAGDVPWPDEPAARLAAQASIPQFIAQRWHRRLGADAAHRLAESLNRPGPVTVRANRARTDRDALARTFAARSVPTEPGRWAPDALHLRARADIRGSRAWQDGDYEVQDEGSQLVAEAVQAAPGHEVLDLCAGSGGKTLALAASMGDAGSILAADVSAPRLADLEGRVRRRGLRSVEARALDGDPGADLGRSFDRVLVDAPCSETGTWRRGPDRRWHITEADVAAAARTQVELLGQGTRHVRPGGRLVYATCSLLEEENQAVVSRFLALHQGFEPAPCLDHLPAFDADPQIELRPDVHGTDGFFIAAFERRG